MKPNNYQQKIKQVKSALFINETWTLINDLVEDPNRKPQWPPPKHRNPCIIGCFFKDVQLSCFFNKLIQLDPVIWWQTKFFLIHRAVGHEPAQPTTMTPAPNHSLSLRLNSWWLGALRSPLETNTLGVSAWIDDPSQDLLRYWPALFSDMQLAYHPVSFHQLAWPISHPSLRLSTFYLVS